MIQVFKLDWTTPTWSEGRDMIGAVMEVTDGVNAYTEFIPFASSVSPSLPTGKSFQFDVPEAGEFSTQVWLVDELGNEDMKNAKAVTAYYDNVPPDNYCFISQNHSKRLIILQINHNLLGRKAVTILLE